MQGYVLGLGIVRSLGMMNIKSILLYNKRNEIARVSKKVLKSYRCPLWSNMDDAKNFLIKKRKELNSGMLIPTSDLQIEFLAKYKNILEEHYTVPVPDQKEVKLFLDKKETYRIANKSGIEVPISFFPSSYDEAFADAQNINIPLIIKPRERDRFFGIFHEKLFIVKNEKELIQKLKLCFQHNLKIMITEIIPGPDTCLYEYSFYQSKSGEIIAGIGHVKLRQSPPNFGIGSVIKTSENDDIAVLTKKFLNYAPGFFGPGQIEFKLDPRDKKYKLIEMNGRISLHNELYAKAGVNLANLYYQEWANGTSVKAKKYIENFYWTYLFIDLVNIISYYNKDSGFLIDYIRPYLKKHMYAIESFSEPEPMILYWSQLAKKSVSKTLRFITKNK